MENNPSPDTQIMIIEDEAIIAKDIENILLNYGYGISGIYAKAEDALESLKTKKPDLILMDVVLKGHMDGIEAAKMIKKIMKVPIIFITAYADETTISRIKKIEPHGYFLKPFEEKELQTWIETTLHKFNSEESTYKNEKLALSIVENSEEAILVFDKNHSVTYINKAAEKLTGWDRNSALNEKLDKIVGITGVNLQIDILLNSYPKGKPFFNKTSFINKNNQRFEIYYSVFALSNYESVFSFRESTDDPEKEILSKKLDQAYKDAEKFAYIASHDLQEPLRMIASYVQLLKKRYQGKLDSRANEFIDFSVSGVNRMKNMIDDLLLYSRINTNHMAKEKVDCEKLVAEVINKLSSAESSRKPVFKCSPLPVITADRGQMSQLFLHLLTNSLKFNENNPPVVEVNCSKQNDNWVFSVSDNGIGIEEAYHGKIFEAFQKLHNQKDYPGNGIGLAVCKKIVELHGGHIRVDSEPGKGTVFHFNIPYKQKST
jgi:signal transduction histidine kinase/AmiR/NasT family two-component response regulator